MKRILLVDDDQDLLISLKYYLKKRGYDVTTTRSCKDGLRILFSVAPHLVLLDINVGEEDGRDMCRQIKSQAESQHIPVLLISANHQLLQTYEEHGANGSLQKPFDLPSLLTAIEKIISP